MSDHVVSLKVYVGIFLALMVLTAVTVWAAYLDLEGPLNTVLALSIAILKTTLVILYFMHVRYSDKLTWVFALAGFFWLVILLALLMADYISRPWQVLGQGW